MLVEAYAPAPESSKMLKSESTSPDLRGVVTMQTSIDQSPAHDTEIDRILADLAAADSLPRDALEWAAAHRHAVTPVFLEAIESYLQYPDSNRNAEPALMFIVHLLAQFRESRAYPLVMRLVSLEPERVERILGEATTETLPKVAISLFDGDPGPIQSVIENEAADEFIRLGLFEAMAFLVKEGRADLKAFKKYLLQSYADLQPQHDNQVWVGWQSAISLLGLSEFKELVRKAFASGKIHPGFMSFRDFEADLRATVTGSGEGLGSTWTELDYFDDTVAEFESWVWGPEDADPDLPREAANSNALSGDPYFLRGETYVNEFRHVGRNDPCPCGSGKKFKKCCLD